MSLILWAGASLPGNGRSLWNLVGQTANRFVNDVKAPLKQKFLQNSLAQAKLKYSQMAWLMTAAGKR
ncbi:hypothetical protein AVDCRST_MAG94-1972 [uncultured Leptolyngbya sp.]|uniref:Uncharacterized protein n=1 Tax=uncultured Leptolyngbya sp. TaxID=332963 RepID=A0A6J4LI10_9CYAN|nr:hypothetical protein AVDCRST_MAG94-1972 [uncultured Leptolyngbya sp.]